MNNIYGNNFLGGSPYNQPINNVPQQNIIVVPISGGDEAVKSYPVGAGNTVLLLDYPNKKFWLKSMESDGFRSTIVSHTFSVDQDSNNNEGFVTKQEFNELKKMLDDLTK